MGSKIINLEILLIYCLLLIPWPYTPILKFLCSRDNARLVRKIVRSKWTPILDKYQVKLPLECPLHPTRDSFAPRQDAKKRDRPTQWTCRLCGKSFYQEKFLDLHFETRHKFTINKAEDAVCLADYCDIMRCEVFQTEESSSLKIGDQQVSTDIEVWGDSFGQNSALAKANVAYLSLLPLRTSAIGAGKVQNRQIRQEQVGQHLYSQTDNEINENSFKYDSNPKYRHYHSADNTASSSTSSHSYGTVTAKNIQNNLSESPNNSVHNKGQNESHNISSETVEEAKSNESVSEEDSIMHKVKANCNTEEINKLKAKCEQLVRSCIGGLILQMTDQTFQEMEEEMNKAVCWYLTCERYWEDGPLEPRAFPWGLILILTFVLSTGICFCYYIIWILFDSSEETTVNNANHGYENIQPLHRHHHPSVAGAGPALLHPQEQYHYQEYPTTGIHHGVINDTPPESIQYFYRQQQQQQQHQQQQQQQHQQQQQQAQNMAPVTSHDLYPEPVLYDYRHSPRRYTGDPHPPGTPTITMPMLVGPGQTPLRHPPTSGMVYQQDILDRHDYISSRPVATTAVNSINSGTNIGPNAAFAAANHPVAPPRCDGEIGVSGPGGSGGKHFNTMPRPLEARQRYVSGSQQSLRTSASINEIIQNEVGQNEHYIYVTYPPDLKKRFFEKYE